MRAVVPPAMVTAVQYITDRQNQLERINGDKTDVTEGHIVGLMEAKALILDAIVAEANNPATPL